MTVAAHLGGRCWEANASAPSPVHAQQPPPGEEAPGALTDCLPAAE